MIKIYTDGAYSSARNQGGIGVVVLREGCQPIKFSKAYVNTTNNRMEILAVIKALSMIAKPIDKLEIVSDSMYVIGCASMGWKRKKNKDLWKQYDEVFKSTSLLCPNISFTHVKGHNGDEYNEMCDKLAVAASELWIDQKQ